MEPPFEDAPRALFDAWPQLRGRVPWTALGELPTPLQRLTLPKGELWVKRDDLTSPIYGGNKVRTLEVLFGWAKAQGATRIHSTGAYGSNHAAATVLHAERVGLEPGVILFPQPRSFAALENLRVVLARRPVLHALPHWSLLPAGILWARRQDRRAGIRSHIMVPGGATPRGALGYVSAALELAQQVERGEMPAPKTVLVGVGSTCTSAGLLLGLRAAAELGIGWRAPPRLVSVRVTPWPVTSSRRITSLAHRAAHLLSEESGEPRWAFDRRILASGLEVDGRYLGRGYGMATPEGLEAMRTFGAAAGWSLDTTYSAKAAAAALDRIGNDGPLVFWSTKSTAPLPPVHPQDWRWAPRRVQRWIERAEARCAPPALHP